MGKPEIFWPKKGSWRPRLELKKTTTKKPKQNQKNPQDSLLKTRKPSRLATDKEERGLSHLNC